MYSAELLAKVNVYRAKAEEGTLTNEDMKEFITLLRADRTAAAKTAKPRSGRAEEIDGEALLNDLLGI